MVVSDNSPGIPKVLLQAASTGSGSISVCWQRLWAVLSCSAIIMNVRCPRLPLSFLCADRVLICANLLLLGYHQGLDWSHVMPSVDCG